MRNARLAVVITALLLALPWPVQVQQPIFRSGVDGIRVDVLATAERKPIAGLGAGDFELRDNGVPQTITVTPRADLSVRVLLVLDVSSSVQGEKLQTLRAAARALLGALAPGDEAGLTTFHHSVVQRVPPGRDFTGIQEALEQVTTTGNTALHDATLAGLLLGQDDASRSLVIVFSDGADTVSFQPAPLVLETAKAGNVVLYGAWSSRRGRADFLREVAEVSGGRLLEVSDPSSMAGSFVEILREFRQRYLITFTPTGVMSKGWHTLDIRLKIRRGNLRYRRGYFGAEA